MTEKPNAFHALTDNGTAERAYLFLVTKQVLVLSGRHVGSWVGFVEVFGGHSCSPPMVLVLEASRRVESFGIMLGFWASKRLLFFNKSKEAKYVERRSERAANRVYVLKTTAFISTDQDLRIYLRKRHRFWMVSMILLFLMRLSQTAAECKYCYSGPVETH